MIGRRVNVCIKDLVLMEFTRTNTKPDGEIRQTYKQISLLYFRIHLHKFKVNFNSSGWRACKCKWRLFTFYLHLDRIICGQIHAKIHTIFLHKYTHFALHWKMNWTSWKFDLTHKNTLRNSSIEWIETANETSFVPASIGQIS